MTTETTQKIPLGCLQFHQEPNMNYQFNRILTVCGGNLKELELAAANIRTLEDWTREFRHLADKALKDGRLQEQAAYIRAENFYLDSESPRKMETWLSYTRLIRSLNSDLFTSGQIQEIMVPYGKGLLPVWHMAPHESSASAPKVLFHLGYDSLKEELLPVLTSFAAQGLDVWLFEGPGQGEALYRHGIPMTHEWEKPVKAVLDHLGIADITLVGLSLGGYLAPRAACFEPRIKRVVAWGVLYDFFEVVSSRRGKGLELFLRFCTATGARRLLNRVVGSKMKTDTYTRWGVSHGMTVFGAASPWDYFTTLKNYSLKKLSHLISQDFLLIGSTEDHFIPSGDFYRQIKALSNTRSLTARLFTREEQAQNHVQFGNLPLAVRVMADWIKERSQS